MLVVRALSYAPKTGNWYFFSACACVCLCRCALQLICFMLILMNERCVYEFKASTSLSGPAIGHSQALRLHLTFGSHHIESPNLPMFTSPQWIDEHYGILLHFQSGLFQANGMVKIGTSISVVGSFVLSARLFTFGRWTMLTLCYAAAIFIIESIFFELLHFFSILFSFIVSFYTFFLLPNIIMYAPLCFNLSCHKYFVSPLPYTFPRSSVCWQQLDCEMVHFARTLPKLGSVVLLMCV